MVPVSPAESSVAPAFFRGIVHFSEFLLSHPILQNRDTLKPGARRLYTRFTVIVFHCFTVILLTQEPPDRTVYL